MQTSHHDYTSGHVVIVLGGNDFSYEGEFGLGDMLQTIYPEWHDDEKYDMDWSVACEKHDRFRKFELEANLLKKVENPKQNKAFLLNG